MYPFLLRKARCEFFRLISPDAKTVALTRVIYTFLISCLKL